MIQQTPTIKRSSQKQTPQLQAVSDGLWVRFKFKFRLRDRGSESESELELEVRVRPKNCFLLVLPLPKKIFASSVDQEVVCVIVEGRALIHEHHEHHDGRRQVVRARTHGAQTKHNTNENEHIIFLSREQ